MTRVINPNAPGQLRIKLLKSVKAAALEIIESGGEGDEIQDLAAFCYSSLLDVQETITQTAEAWERRDYWVKADKFRYQWAWVITQTTKIANNIKQDKWDAMHDVAEVILENTSGINVPKKLTKEQPWQGAWQGSLARDLTSRSDVN